MFQKFEEIQKLGKENADAAVKSLTAVAKGYQAIAAEIADYTKKSFEDGSATIEKLLATKTLDKAFEMQSEFAKAAYEAAVARTTKIGEMYSVLAKDAYKPVQEAIAKVAPAAK
jgi:phasin family protein